MIYMNVIYINKDITLMKKCISFKNTKVYKSWTDGTK